MRASPATRTRRCSRSSTARHRHGIAAAAPLAEPPAARSRAAAPPLPGARARSSIGAASSGCASSCAGVGDVERILARVALRSARPRDLTQLRSSLAALPALRARARGTRGPAAGRARASASPSTSRSRRCSRRRSPRSRPRSCATATSSPPATTASSTSCAASPPTPTSSCSSSRGASASAPASRRLKLGYNRVQGFFIEVEPPRRRARAQGLRAPPDGEVRRALHHRGAQGLRGQGARRAREGARARAGALRGAARRAWAMSSAPLQATAAALAELDALAALAERAAALEWTRARAHGRGAPAINGGRHPVVERFCERAVRAQRSAPRRRAAHAHHHRPQHGRQIHLHAPGGAHRAARARRQLRAGRARRCSGPSTASSRASAPAMTWPAAARPSWWR